MTIKEFTELGKQKCLQSICKFRVSAIGLNKDGQIVARAMNIPRFRHKGGGIHAERALMKNYRFKGIKTILICRTSKNGNILPIHPCPVCKKIAKKLNIKIIPIC
jgi:cytidine deaminase